MTIAVAPAAQGRGLAGLSSTPWSTSARQRGAGRLLLEVRADNVAARNLYVAAGFEQLGTSGRATTAVPDRDGGTGDEVDALVLALPLSDRPSLDSVAP